MVQGEIEALCQVRLREIRKARGFTLSDFEELSGGEFKAVVMGSYERGSRAISLARLERIAAIYQLPIEYFLGSELSEGNLQSAMCFDLRVLRSIENPSEAVAAIKRYLSLIARKRSDWRGEILTLRSSDCEQMESTLTDNGTLREQLLREKILIAKKS